MNQLAMAPLVKRFMMLGWCGFIGSLSFPHPCKPRTRMSTFCHVSCAVRMNQDPAAVEPQASSQGQAEEPEDEDGEAERASWSQERIAAEDLVAALVEEWRAPM